MEENTQWLHFLLGQVKVHKILSKRYELYLYCPLAQVTLRIVAMMQNGELDPAIAMQLLGQGMTAAAPKGDASDPQNGKKRPLHAVGEGESQEPDGDQEIDAFLKEAKKVRLDA